MKLSALVVDDSTVMRKVISSALLTMNFDADHISHAADGEEGVKIAAEKPFSIILMDWNMPNKTGIEAVAEIRASGNKTPILMVTTEGERENVVKAIQAGANNYLVKPFNTDDLRVKVEQLLIGSCE